ncbi:hypothetical protein MmiHf6_02960 [Methanimicrococcus hongohii]|uniref:UPF0212 protein MmiHf6_02960 n=1 Tax=Methanimicrococcus hongohii TaxID=3028295 RepID=A0AA96ZS36_9EURY|nr:DUF555 domain-containing protein [Methanimicrococcus sp. Hf6]WNY23000.1 hypothetical protein MmiHf6_02960 [Methanimicrococcus sp. Hf6]
MPNFNVFLEGAWLVKDVATGEDAIGIAISEAGKRLNPRLEFVGVDVGTMSCASCDEELMSVYVVANTALVGLLFQMKVYEAESEEHASRIATSVIGKALRDVPLKIVEVDEFVADSRPPRQSEGQGRGRSEHRSGEHGGRGERRDRSERGERGERGDRSERRSRDDRDRGDDRRGRNERGERSEKSEQYENDEFDDDSE